MSGARFSSSARKNRVSRKRSCRARAFRKHSGQMKRVFSELSPEELRGLETALKKVGKRATALMEES